MSTVFQLFDIEGKGGLSLDSLKQICELVEEDFDEAFLQEMVNDLDSNADGLINEEDFVRMLRRTVCLNLQC